MAAVSVMLLLAMIVYARTKVMLFSFISVRVNKSYELQTDSGKIPVYCHMTSDGIGACGGGGWTMVMKIDGNKV